LFFFLSSCSHSFHYPVLWLRGSSHLPPFCLNFLLSCNDDSPLCPRVSIPCRPSKSFSPFPRPASPPRAQRSTPLLSWLSALSSQHSGWNNTLLSFFLFPPRHFPPLFFLLTTIAPQPSLSLIVPFHPRLFFLDEGAPPVCLLLSFVAINTFLFCVSKNALCPFFLLPCD